MHGTEGGPESLEGRGDYGAGVEWRQNKEALEGEVLRADRPLSKTGEVSKAMRGILEDRCKDTLPVATERRMGKRMESNN